MNYQIKTMALVYFSGPWEHILILWQYLIFYYRGGQTFLFKGNIWKIFLIEGLIFRLAIVICEISSKQKIFFTIFSLFGHIWHKICTVFENFIVNFCLYTIPHYYFQMIASSKGRKDKLEGRMRPAGLTLGMSALFFYNK